MSADVTVNIDDYVNSTTIVGTYNTIHDGYTVAEEISSWTENGLRIEFFANGDKVITDVVAVGYDAAECTKVSTDKKTGDVTYTLKYGIHTDSYTDYADEDVDDEIFFDAAPAKGDIVTFAEINSSVASHWGRFKFVV